MDTTIIVAIVLGVFIVFGLGMVTGGLIERYWASK